jgi:outer membrane receptor protein involved in Fe transport
MDPRQPTYFVIKRNGVTPSFVQPLTIEQDYRSKLELYTAELQQIWQTPVHTVIGGARLQTGEFRAYNLQTDPAAGDLSGLFPTNGPAALQNFETDFHRASVYGYYSFRVSDSFQLVGGLTYEHITYPANLRNAPLSPSEETADRLLPKAGFIWTPQDETAIRFAYTRSLAGAGIDQTFLLEPSQVAGFNQSFRSIIPESVGGAKAGAEFETFGLSLEHQFPCRTYAAISGQILRSDLNRTVGIFSRRTGIDDFAIPDTTRERLDFEERVLLMTLDKLLGEEWAIGVRYRVTDAELTSDLREVPDGVSSLTPSFRPRQHLESTLHQLTLQAIWNHRSGFFAYVQGLWNVQNSNGYLPPVSGENFWQANLFAGYRIPRRKAEFTVGLLNVTDRDYRLNPLTLHNDLPRERTFVARFGFSF